MAPWLIAPSAHAIDTRNSSRCIRILPTTEQTLSRRLRSASVIPSPLRTMTDFITEFEPATDEPGTEVFHASFEQIAVTAVFDDISVYDDMDAYAETAVLDDAPVFESMTLLEEADAMRTDGTAVEGEWQIAAEEGVDRTELGLALIDPANGGGDVFDPRIARCLPMPFPPRQLAQVIVAPAGADGVTWRAEQWLYGDIALPNGASPIPGPSPAPEEASEPPADDPDSTPGELLLLSNETRKATSSGSLWSVVLLNDSASLELARFTDVKISLYEERFAQDLDGDGEITPRLADRLLDDGSQNDGIGLQLSGEGILSLLTAEGELPLYGLGSQLSNGAADDAGYVAAAASDLGGYWLAYRYMITTWDEAGLQLEPQTHWSLQLLDSNGAQDGSRSFWDVDIRRFEDLFAQDLDGDGEITPRPADQVIDDGSQSDGIGLQRSGEGLLFLTTPTGTLPLYQISGLYGGDPTTADIAYVAAAASESGGYWLAYRYPVSSGPDQDTSTSWSLVMVDREGRPDWSTSYADVDIRHFEQRFEQDLDGDGEISPRPADQVIDDGSQSDGIGLQLSGEGLLQLTTADGAISLHQLGLQPQSGFQYVAAAAAQGSGYWLARHIQLERLSEEETNPEAALTWSVQKVDANGAIEWGLDSWNAEISAWEATFEQDLDGDGEITAQLDPTVLDDGSQPDGVGLTLSAVGIVTFTEADQTLPLYGLGFQAAPADDQDRFVAAAAAESGGYWLARSSPQWSVDDQGEAVTSEQRSWTILAITAEGQQDWSLSYSVSDISSWEGIFAQDLDGDGLINPEGADPQRETAIWGWGWGHGPFYGYNLKGQIDGDWPLYTMRGPEMEEDFYLSDEQGLGEDQGESSDLDPRLLVTSTASSGRQTRILRALDGLTGFEAMDQETGSSEAADTDFHGLPMFGTRGDDSMIGTRNNDRIIGARSKAQQFGRDVIASGAGYDQIVLGSSMAGFYNVAGDADYALIKKFDLNRDQLVLHGKLKKYSVEPGMRMDGMRGDGLYNTDGDLIALIQTRDQTPFDLTSAAMTTL